MAPDNAVNLMIDVIFLGHAVPLGVILIKGCLAVNAKKKKNFRVRLYSSTWGGGSSTIRIAVQLEKKTKKEIRNTEVELGLGGIRTQDTDTLE